MLKSRPQVPAFGACLLQGAPIQGLAWACRCDCTIRRRCLQVLPAAADRAISA